jgi:hypothetical protein
LKEAVNDTLRRGLQAAAEGHRAKPKFVTKGRDLGPARVPLDNVAEALAAAEGENFR